MHHCQRRRKFFVSSRIYRVGGDEFVVLTPNLPPYDVWTASDRMRVFLREKDCEISVGIQNTNNLRKLEAAVNKAEQAMQQDKLAYYGRNGQERQLKGLNEKLERTLTQKRDAEHFLRVLAPKYRSVYVVNLQDDSVRPIILPGLLPEDPGHLRRLLPCRHHRLPRPVCGAGIPRRLQQRAGLQLCAQQGAERRDRGGALHQNRRCTLHPQDHPVFLQRLSYPRDHLDLCR